ncbi:MAG: hypothetical protein ACFFD1_11020, partial [Candidatus Thorarchaeota archaeon]
MDFSAPKKIILSAKNLYLFHNILDKDQIGKILGQNIFGRSPNFISVDKIDKNFRESETGLMLFYIKFNSEIGPFSGYVTFKQFNSIEEVEHNVLLNKWLEDRVKNNENIRIPKIYSKGENYIIYEGFPGEDFEISFKTLEKKSQIAGELLATYHSFDTSPADSKRYVSLFTSMIAKLPIDKPEMDKLLNIAFTYLVNYDHSRGSIYSYGFFQPDNVILNDENQKAYLFDPEFLESTLGAERLEDIASFFLISSLDEFKQTGTIDRTFKSMKVFFDSYNRYLQSHQLSIERLFSVYEIWGIFFFHLGLAGLKRVKFMLETPSLQPRKRVGKIIEHLQEVNDFIKFIWVEGIKYLPDHVFPMNFKSQKINREGWVMSWVAIGRSIFEKLKEDQYFQLIYKRPKNFQEMSLKECASFWKIKGPKDLAKAVEILNDWFKSTIITIKEKKLVYTEEIINDLEFKEISDNWEKTTRKLKDVYLKNPENFVINQIVERRLISIDDLDNMPNLEKKVAKDIV